jgi:opacity protein-like surface antigen
MRTLSTFAAAAALVAGLATASQAQTPVNPLLPTTGTREIFLDGNIGFDPNFLDINVGYGPFLNPNLQVGGQIGGSGGENSATQYRVAAFANYHFPGASAVLPYVGVSLGYSKTNGGNDEDTSVGLQGGIKYFLNPNVAARVEGRYDFNDDGNFGINLGLAVYLR